MMHYNLEWLQKEFDRKGSMDYIFFWGHTNKSNEPLGPFIFSQWYPAPFVVDDVPYKTAEHWMMAGKAKLFRDAETLEKIIRAATPKEAKEWGRKVRGFDKDIWDSKCFDLVKQGNWYKFTRNNGFKNYLVATGEKVIVEASPFDTVWGIGLTGDSPRAKNPHSWRGQNLLGFALMEVRDMLQREG